MKVHNYQLHLQWTGNTGTGTNSYKTYSRDFKLSGKNKSLKIPGSSDPEFLGDPARYNPEELFISSISSCHMLWYLHLCAVNHVIVEKYEDEATGILEEDDRGDGRFLEITLHPKVWVADEKMLHKAKDLHHEANRKCFIANSLNFRIQHEPQHYTIQASDL